MAANYLLPWLLARQGSKWLGCDLDDGTGDERQAGVHGFRGLPARPLGPMKSLIFTALAGFTATGPVLHGDQPTGESRTARVS